MNKEALVSESLAAIEDGSFLTPKHHPSGVGNLHRTFRSITTLDESGLSQFFEDGKYTILQYRNNKQEQSPAYYVINPIDQSFVPGSGIPPESPPTHANDRFVVVSGINQGYHIFTNEQEYIDKEVSGGNLVFEQEVL